MSVRKRVSRIKQLPRAARPAGMLALTAVLAATGTGVALAATTGSHSSHRISHVAAARKAKARARSHFSVLRNARAASAAAVSHAPAGAVLALGSGGVEIYAWQPSSTQSPPGKAIAGAAGQICIVERWKSGSASIACSPSSQAQNEGVALISLPSKTQPTLSVGGLVPNGVTSVLATDSNGASHTVGVTDNAFYVEDASLATLRYALPSGGSHTVNVAEVASGQDGAQGEVGSNKAREVTPTGTHEAQPVG